MITIADQLIGEFIAAVNKRFGIPIPDGSIVQDAWPAPHKAKDLPAGVGAVYVFSLPDKTTSVLGSGRALKVGKVGPNSNPRFRYQHYKSGSAQSTLAGAIENNRLLWDVLGFNEALSESAGDWIRTFTDRQNFYVQESRRELIGPLEVYLKARLGPDFEGPLSSNL